MLACGKGGAVSLSLAEGGGLLADMPDESRSHNKKTIVLILRLTQPSKAKVGSGLGNNY